MESLSGEGAPPAIKTTDTGLSLQAGGVPVAEEVLHGARELLTPVTRAGTGGERLDVGGQLGELAHATSLPAPRSGYAPPGVQLTFSVVNATG